MVYGVNREGNEALNFYFNNMSFLERYIVWFEKKMHDNIQLDTSGNLVILPGYVAHPEMEKKIATIKQANTDFADAILRGASSPSLAKLTKRENECVGLLAKGYTLKMIAAELNVSPRTAEQHIRNSKDKLNLHTKRQLLEYWYAEFPT